MNEKYSFIDLFNHKIDLNKTEKVNIDHIIIPKIQRPYAQGRLDNVSTYIRDTFTTEIFEALEKNDAVDFNFIYGIVRPSNENYAMELLDGQQRLTTLFLIYWYIANQELETGSSTDMSIRDCLAKFIYETRSTSTVFCKQLANYKVDLEGKKPTDVIRLAKWYFKSFDRDSTIASMLVMLDAIDQKYKKIGKPNMHEGLNKIQFYVKTLGVYNLSEELYIKMNARGLQLSPFENFKADLTNFVSNSPQFKKLVSLYKKGSDDLLPFHLNFSTKLDAKWIDIFWKYHKNEESANFDVAYMNFFSRFFACKYIESSFGEVSDAEMRSDKTIRTLYTEESQDSINYLGFKVFLKILEKKPQYIELLDVVLDVFHEFQTLISQECVAPWDRAEQKFDDFFYNENTRMTQSKLILLASIIEYIEAFCDGKSQSDDSLKLKELFDETRFKQWMRVVRNVIENTNIDSLTPVSSLIRKFSSLIYFASEGMKSKEVDFYTALSAWNQEHADDRGGRAIEEEINKAKRIAENKEWEAVFIEAESHPYFKGMVSFFYSKEMSLKQFIHQYSLVKTMFDKDGISPKYRKKHLLIRAIVSQFKSWDELNERYITERAETNKYLKNTLAAHDGVKKLFRSLFDKTELELEGYLNHTIDSAKEDGSWTHAYRFETKAALRLRTDIRMYDWIEKESQENRVSFRVYVYEGIIMFAVPRRQYLKIALDTDRAKVAKELANKYQFEFWDQNQLNMYNLYNDCFGNDIWVCKKYGEYTINVHFTFHHNLEIRIECKSKKVAKMLSEHFNNYEFNDNYLHRFFGEHFEYVPTLKKIEKELAKVYSILDNFK